MKLLLDEMYPTAVVDALRDRTHDVIAVQEDATLRGLPDDAMFDRARELGRALVTENVQDFARLAADARARGAAHASLVFTTNAAFPRHRERFIGAIVRVLHVFLEEHAEDSVGAEYWLQSPVSE